MHVILGDMMRQSKIFYKRLASLLAVKWDQTYSSSARCWVRIQLSSSLLRSVIQCIHGAPLASAVAVPSNLVTYSLLLAITFRLLGHFIITTYNISLIFFYFYVLFFIFYLLNYSWLAYVIQIICSHWPI